VTILNDGRIKYDRTLSLNLFNPTGGAVGGLTNAVLTIVAPSAGDMSSLTLRLHG